MVGIDIRKPVGLAVAMALLVGCQGESAEAPEATGCAHGTWVVEGDNENEILMLVFFEDGTYLHAEYDAEAAGGEVSGMEWGPLSWDDVGVLDIGPATFDGNGDTGLTDFVGTSDLTCAVSGNTMTLDITGGPDAGESLHFSRLVSAGASGTFINTETDNELLAFTFLPGNTYCHFEYDDQPGDEINGMECSGFSLDSEGVFTVTEADVLVDNNGDTGLTDFVGTSDVKITFTADAMELEISGEGAAPETVAFDRLD